MLIHSLLVESVDLRRLGGSAGGNDLLSDRFDRCQAAPGEKELGSLSREGACDSSADCASGPVDHCNLVLQHHLWFLSERHAPPYSSCRRSQSCHASPSLRPFGARSRIG